ncbi:MAG: hypothetical protein ACC641_08195 [Acidiferrobacterales bacterium]
MKIPVLVFLFAFPIQASAESILFGDYEKGNKLHKNGCTTCHDSSVYTRSDRKINTINGLEGQVERCSNSLRTNYTSDQNGDIVKFLNDDYYKF